MGWSWALWIVHETLFGILGQCALPGDVTVLDKTATAPIKPDGAAFAAYVDNATVLARKKAAARSRLERAVA
eukprot:8479123-Lingulodinium_polyedra.AAC.1